MKYNTLNTKLFFSILCLLSNFALAQSSSFNAGLSQQKCEPSAVQSVSITSLVHRFDNEGTSNIPFQITLTASLRCPLKVYMTVTGTAVAGVDYDSLQQTITIPAGTTVYNGTYNLLSNATKKDFYFNYSIMGTNRKKVRVATSYYIRQEILENPANYYSDYSRMLQVSNYGDGSSYSHTCGINYNGELFCVGNNTSGELGNNSTTQLSTFTQIDDGMLYREIKSGQNHTCGLTEPGELRCFGLNSSGQLGLGDTTTRLTPTIVDTTKSFISVSTKGNNTCAIDATGALYCFGENAFGELGDNSTTTRLSPTLIDSGVSYKAIAMGKNHACGITTSDALKCWGRNQLSQLGDGGVTDSLTPIVVDSGVSYAQIATGENHTCALTTSNVLKCWGDNSVWQVSSASGATVPSPITIESGTSFSQVSAGMDHTCAIDGTTEFGVLKCWGGNSQGQLGTGSTSTRSSAVTIVSGTDFGAIDAGARVTCAIAKDKRMYCFGNASAGALGFGSGTESTPTMTFLNRTLLDFTSNGNCVVTASGVLKCSGAYAGDGTSNILASMTEIDTSMKYLNVEQGSDVRCALRSDNIVRCWGRNLYGAVGDGTTSSVTTPKTIDSAVYYRKIANWHRHSCGIKTDGRLKCWGQNTYGQLGNNATTTNNLPQNVSDNDKYVSVSVGTNHTCGITIVGVLKCWGRNNSSQLGDGTTSDSLIPIVVDSGVRYKSVTAHDSRNCGLTIDGTLKCWGYRAGMNVTNYSTPTIQDASFKYKKHGYTCGTTFAGTNRCHGEMAGFPSFATFYNLTNPDLYHLYKKYKAINSTLCALSEDGMKLQCLGENATGNLHRSSIMKLMTPTYFASNVVDVSPARILGTGCYAELNRVLCWGKGSNVGDGNSSMDKAVPMIIPFSGSVKMLTGSGDGVRCLLTTVGEVYCWGSNADGGVGDGTTTAKTTPVRIDVNTLYTQISSSGFHTCGVTTAGVLKCWGRNNAGQIGDGSTTNRLTPTIIDSGVQYKFVSTDQYSWSVSCGITTADVLKCWGANNLYQLGDGTTTNSLVPKITDSGEGYVFISSGAVSCGITTNSKLKCWGSSVSGPLGDGTSKTSNSTPLAIDAGENFKYVNSFDLNRCAITTGGTLKCWGYGDYGAIGHGTTTSPNAPVTVDSGNQYLLVKTVGYQTCGITTLNELKCTGSDINFNAGRGDHYTHFMYMPDVFVQP